jgi:hypothetical protein
MASAAGKASIPPTPMAPSSRPITPSPSRIVSMTKTTTMTFKAPRTNVWHSPRPPTVAASGTRTSVRKAPGGVWASESSTNLAGAGSRPPNRPAITKSSTVAPTAQAGPATPSSAPASNGPHTVVAPSRKPADAVQATSCSGRLTSDGTNADVIGRNDPIATPITAAKARMIGTGPPAASTTTTPDDASAAVNASSRNTLPRP